MYGKDESSGPLETTLTFEYTEFLLNSVIVPMNTGINPGVGLASNNADLADMNGDAFPDLIHTGDVHKVYINNDGRKWNEPYNVPGGFSAIQLSGTNTMFMDMNGDGHSDLFLQGGGVDEYQYFAGGQPNNGWASEQVKMRNSPVFTFGHDTKPVDLDNDGMTDIF